MMDILTHQEYERALAYEKSCAGFKRSLLRWLRWIFMRQEFCPRCNNISSWSARGYKKKTMSEYHCMECGLDTAWLCTAGMKAAIDEKERHDGLLRCSSGQ